MTLMHKVSVEVVAASPSPQPSPNLKAARTTHGSLPTQSSISPYHR